MEYIQPTIVLVLIINRQSPQCFGVHVKSEVAAHRHQCQTPQLLFNFLERFSL